MKSIRAPWRAKYFEENEEKKQEKVKQCPFCDIVKFQNSQIQNTDDLGRILATGSHCFAILNKHPYSYGHLLIVPFVHKMHLDEIPSECWLEMSLMVRDFEFVLRKILHCDGVNIGMNLGVSAGASIAEHMHYHLVPRWSGDTNFMATIAQTRVLGGYEDKIRQDLKNAYENLKKSKQ